ncbi:MAG TPA: hypothetical protein VM425_00795 [Myxococcota bacterium]|nr:hypothetical protein [Myxococcota bacterium]
MPAGRAYLLIIFLPACLLSFSALGSDLKSPPPAGQPAGIEEKQPAAEFCRVHLDFGQLAFEEVKIDKDALKVTGPDFNLQREGDVVYGFMLSKPTRFRVKADSISGTAAGMDLMLHVKREALSTEVSGLVGIRRVVARVSGNKVSVAAAGSSQVASTAHLSLTRSSGNLLKGQIGLGAGMSAAGMVTFGCDLDFIRERPELIVILFMWWLGV